MKLLILTKRHLTAKDTIREEFGRYYELAVGLSTLGWQVKGHGLDYRSRWGREAIRSGGVDWHSYSVPLSIPGWLMKLRREAYGWKPDVVLASSDPIHIAAGLKAGRLARAPLVVDLHDNLESFRLTRVPGLLRALRKAIHQADLVCSVSEPLQDKVIREYAPGGKLLVIENAVPKAFGVLTRDSRCNRQRYGLKNSDRVIGVAGALYRKRGIETILAAFEVLHSEDSNVVLALAGPTDDSIQDLSRDGIHYFGNLEYSAIPGFLDTFDIGIVPNIRPVFADYCYPQKAVELCAMSVPFVAADLGVMRHIASGHPEILYQPHRPDDLARAIRYQLENRIVPNVVVKTWAQQSEKLHGSLTRLLQYGHK